MNIRQLVERDRADWTRMRHEIEVRNHFETAAAARIVFVAEAHGRLVGFVDDSHAAHAALGFEEVERVVCFRRAIQRKGRQG